MQKFLSHFSKLTRLNLFIALFLLSFFSIYRLIFFWTFSNNTQHNDILYAFYLGLKFDWRLAILMVLPILLTGWLSFLHPLKNAIASLFWRLYLTLAFTVVSSVYFFDFGHYSYLKIHLNKTIFRFLDNPEISTTMAWQSYPIIWIGLFFLILIWTFYKIIGKIFIKIQQQEEYKKHLLPKIAINFLVVILVFGSLLAKFSYYPLRWSDAYFNGNTWVADVAQNPVLYAFDTLRYGDTNFDKDLTERHYPRIKEFLKLGDNKTLNYTRELVVTPKIKGNPNVIMVFLESFAGYKTGVFGNPLNPSPHFDKLTKQSLFFDRSYVAHTGTARSVFANISGLIDTQTFKTATRNPLIVNQNTLVNAFTDYQKLYFLGGSANWGNIRGLLSKNIPDLSIYEEGSYSSERQDVWGISDADLFLEASKVLKQTKSPFFAIIQTSGNHRPYTIPEKNYGFKLLNIAEEEVKKYGFESLEELNSFRFMDHSIGLFIQQAKKEGYYDNSVFVFFADHGISYDNGEHSSKIASELNLGSYHIPFIIHAPKMIPAEVNSTVMSHIDTLAIIAGLMNKPFKNSALGRNMLAKKYQDQQYALFIEHGVKPILGLIGQNFLLRVRDDGTNARLFDLRNSSQALDVAKKYPEKLIEMKQLAQALYHTSKYLIYHNPNTLE
jgi:phosphoglycerol transferase MdoB-like AlkP superfamily enzyme